MPNTSITKYDRIKDFVSYGIVIHHVLRPQLSGSHRTKIELDPKPLTSSSNVAELTHDGMSLLTF